MYVENPYIQYMYSYPHKTAYHTLENIDLKKYLQKLAGRENSLYFHIPFCQYKCGYCNLFSVAGQPEQLISEYVDTMERQAVQLSGALPEGAAFSDLTFGGGTPLLLSVPLLRRVFNIARKYFHFISDAVPVVVETSPNQTTWEKLSVLKEEGVSRISIGVQSFQEKELATLHRFHNVDSAKQALHLIRQMDFECTNIDLIYGIPGQTMESLSDSLKQALTFEPEEIFIYPLYVKPDTYLCREGVRRPEGTLQMYRYVRDYLKKAGYHPYSMRRFAKRKNPESLCGFGNTISIGCGGRSYIDNLHFCSPYAVRQEHCMSILAEYMGQTDFLQAVHGFLLPPEEQKRRYAIRHLLFDTGINRKDYQKHFGGEAQKDFPEIIEWEQAGLAAITAEHIALTEEGFALSDYLGPQLISDDIRKRMYDTGIQKGWIK